MPQDMWAYFDPGEGWYIHTGSILVDEPRNSATTELRVLLVEEYRIAIATKHIEAKLSQVVAQGGCRVGTRRDMPRLVPLARQRNNCRLLQTDVPNSQVNQFLDSGTGVVKSGQHCRIAHAAVRGTIRCV